MAIFRHFYLFFRCFCYFLRQICYDFLFVMPKQKTNKSAKKRFKLTAKGKALYKKSGIKHINGHMSSKRKRNLRTPAGVVPEESMNNVIAMFPYAKYAR